MLPLVDVIGPSSKSVRSVAIPILSCLSIVSVSIYNESLSFVLETMSSQSGGAASKPSRPAARPRPLSLESTVITQAPNAPASGHQASPRQPLSPASIAKVKQTFSRAAKRARERSAGLSDWEGVRTPHVQQVSEPRRSAPTTPSLLSPPLVDEPTSYAESNSKQNGRHDPNSDSESEDSHSGDEYTRFKSGDPVQSIWRLPALTAQQRGVLKCSIAYTIATLFTFVPFLSEFLASPFDLEGPVRGGHVVATVATYYNPAKTLGAMFEAVCLRTDYDYQYIN